MDVKGVESVTIKQRIKIMLAQLNQKKKVVLCTKYYLKIGNGKYECFDSEYEVFERLMHEWGKD
jgi:hypothetical protein